MKSLLGTCGCSCDAGATGDNIYNTNGTLTDSLRVVDMNGGELQVLDGTFNLSNAELAINGATGATGQYIQKDPITNTLQWGFLPVKNRILCSMFQPYAYPNGPANIVWNTQNLAIQYTLSTLSGVISFNNTQREVILIDFNIASSLMSDSSTQFRFDIQKVDSGGTTILTTIQSPLTQSGSINEFFNVHANTLNEILPGTTLSVVCTRTSGGGSAVLNSLTGGSGTQRPHTLSLNIIQI